MEFLTLLVFISILIMGVLLWARWSRLDLGLRPPALDGVWLWILVYLLWSAVTWVMWDIFAGGAEAEWVEPTRFSLWEELVLDVVLGPTLEELLFRGALFSALLRRWGIAVAVGVPSLIWGFCHIQQEAWYTAFLIGTGVVLAMIRWKSGSLYIPLGLHAVYNFLATLAELP